jgi:hypothetical protein
MATKKKTKKKSTKSKKRDGRKSPAKRPAQKRRTPKKSAKRKTIPNSAAARKNALAKTPSRKTKSGINKKRRKSEQPRSSAFSRESLGLQSGDLQGLSNAESVDSESVAELMEEGNAFEASVVSGVEDSRERDGKEVRTREVLEDDVPGEYLDEE